MFPVFNRFIFSHSQTTKRQGKAPHPFINNVYGGVGNVGYCFFVFEQGDGRLQPTGGLGE